MSTLSILFLAVALSIDAAVVSFTQGLIFVENKRKNSFLLALSVAFFQTIMPILGWLFARVIYSYVESFSSVIAFLIFFILGAKFIYEALKEEKKEVQKVKLNLSLDYLFIVSVATSIDALGAGVNLYFLGAPLLFASLLIGLVTFLNSILSFWAGYLFKRFPSKYLEIAAGLILILLAILTLVRQKG